MIVISLLLYSITALSVYAITEEENTIYVDDDNTDGPWDGTVDHPYQYIQDGVDAASNGDTVFVFTGLYFENVVINKTIKFVGENKNSTIIDGGGAEDVVFIPAGYDGVIISDFTIQNSGNYSDGYREDAGIDIHINHCEICNNVVKYHPRNGIRMTHADHNVIRDNEVSHSGYQGYLIGSITLIFSDDNNICNNIIKQNNGDGIELRISHSNSISENIISSNYIGINIWDLGGSCTNNTIYHNIIKQNRDGMNIRRSGNFIYQNNFINNSNAHALTLPFAIGRSLPFVIKNEWDENYWDDWIGLKSSIYSLVPKYILFGLNFDWNPSTEPYNIPEK